jgi:hypothetical protein
MTYNPGMESARARVHKGYARMVREALKFSGRPMSLCAIARAQFEEQVLEVVA